MVDAQTGQPAPITYPTKPPSSSTGLIDMRIGVRGAGHRLKLSYVTESPSWKPSYRVVLGNGGKVNLEAWAIVDNTSGEDWNDVKLGVGSSSALSFRFDLRSVRLVERETLQQNDLFAYAPPMGGSTYGNESMQKKLVGDFDDNALAEADRPPPPPSAKPIVTASAPPATRRPGGAHMQREEMAGAQADTSSGFGAGHGNYRGAGAGGGGSANVALDNVQRVARSLQSSPDQIVVEGYAADTDGDKNSASLERANKMRDQLVRNGVDPSKVVAVGRGEQVGRNGGVRVVQTPSANQQAQQAKSKGGEDEANKDGKPDADNAAAEPIGTSHFESGNVTSVARGTSAMVSILHTDTDGEVVYLFDPESARGNAQFPFKSVRLKNPSDSVLETGPVTVFGEGRFIGEGMAEPIPAKSMAFVPFALDRQIVVDGEVTARKRPASRASSPSCSAASSRPRCSTRAKPPSRSRIVSPSARSST